MKSPLLSLPRAPFLHTNQSSDDNFAKKSASAFSLGKVLLAANSHFKAISSANSTAELATGIYPKTQQASRLPVAAAAVP